jgi:hypothetical protein
VTLKKKSALYWLLDAIAGGFIGLVIGVLMFVFLPFVGGFADYVWLEHSRVVFIGVGVCSVAGIILGAENALRILSPDR